MTVSPTRLEMSKVAELLISVTSYENGFPRLSDPPKCSTAKVPGANDPVIPSSLSPKDRFHRAHRHCLPPPVIGF